MSGRLNISESAETPVLVLGEIQTDNLEFAGFRNRHSISSNIGYGASVSYAFSKVNNTTSIKTVNANETVADIVRTARRAKKLTQIELAEKVGMSQRWVSDIERGATAMPRLEALQRLTAVLEIDMARLMIAGRWASSLDTAQELAITANKRQALIESIEPETVEAEVIDLVRRIKWDTQRADTIRVVLRQWIEHDRKALS